MGRSNPRCEEIDNSFRFESGYIHYSPLEGAYSSIFKSQIVLDIATQVSVREDMRPFFRILKQQ